MKTPSRCSAAPPRATRTLGAILIDSGQLTPEDAERVLQLPEGAQPALRRGGGAPRPDQRSRHPVRAVAPVRLRLPAQDARAKRAGSSDELVAAYQPFSPRVEQLRAIRSQLMLRWFDRAEERQVLTIVGAERGEGRSYLAANLAIVFSQLGERTLLVDADMRKPRQH